MGEDVYQLCERVAEALAEYVKVYGADDDDAQALRAVMAHWAIEGRAVPEKIRMALEPARPLVDFVAGGVSREAGESLSVEVLACLEVEGSEADVEDQAGQPLVIPGWEIVRLERLSSDLVHLGAGRVRRVIIADVTARFDSEHSIAEVIEEGLLPPVEAAAPWKIIPEGVRAPAASESQGVAWLQSRSDSEDQSS